MSWPSQRVATATLLVLFAALVWTTRYQYVTSGDIVLRVNRWTGTTYGMFQRAWHRVDVSP